jgi:PAS domain S-box-containing protein
VDLYSIANIALGGFFAFAAIHYLIQWWLSPSERRLLILAVLCAGAAAFCPWPVVLFYTRDPQLAQFALTMRLSLALAVQASCLVFLSHMPGSHGRVLAAVAAFQVGSAALNLLFPANTAALSTVDGHTIVSIQSAHPLWVALIYLTLYIAYVYVLFRAFAMRRKDVVGSIFVAAGAFATLAFGLFSVLIDLAGLQWRYPGALPQAFFVILMSVYLSRQYAERGRLTATSEHRFSTAFEHAPIGIALVGPDGHWLRVNRALCAMLGYSEGELGAITVHDVTHPDDRSSSLAAMDLVRSGQREDYEFEKRCLHKDGHSIWVHCSIALLQDEPGVPARLITQIQNVSERKQAELALRDSEARFRAVFEHAGIGIALVDRSGRLAQFNSSLQQMLGYTADELRSMTFADITHADDATTNIDLFKEMMEGRRSGYSLEKRYVTKDRRVIWAQLTATIVRDQSGEPQHGIGMVQDVSERKHAEQALKASEARFRELFEGVRDIVFTLGPTGVITMLNAAFETSGMKREEWIGRSYLDLVHPDDHRTALTALEESIDGRSPSPALLRIRTGTGYGYSEISTTPHLEGSRVAGAIGIGRDVNDRIQLEEQVRRAQKMEALGRLAGGIAHDFNNLLTVIIGVGRIVHANLDPGSSQAADVSEIIKAGERGATLTRQLLAFSRRQVLEAVDVDLNGVLTSLDGILRRMVGGDVTLQMVLAPDVQTIHADPGQVEQVVANLVLNARDAMPQGGALIIETANVDVDDEFVTSHEGALRGPHVRLTVRDSGLGMSPDVQSKMFDPFFTTKEDGKGTGLGLSTVLGVVQQSNGFIIANSESGRGTTFELFFPPASHAAALAAPPASGSRARGNTIETVLLVDDNQAVRDFATRVLRSGGYHVLTAASGKEAIELVGSDADHLDLVLSDLVMPGMSGVDMVNVFHADHPGLKVLFMSGHPAAVSALGAVGPLLRKPFTNGELIARVRETIEGEPLSRSPSSV